MAEIVQLKIQLLDTTLRGGMQAPHPNPSHKGEAVIFSRPQQLEIANGLGEFGIDRIEICSPVDNPFALVTAREIVKQNQKFSPNTEICVHSRLDIKDIDAALETDADRLNLYIGTSEELRSANKHMTVDDIIDKANSAISYIHEKNPKTKIRFSTEDGFRTPIEDLKKIISSVAQSPYVDTIGIPDTTGLAYPHEVFNLITTIRNIPEMQDKKIEVHFHNDRGMAVANAFMAWLAGAEVIDTSILGLEERDGIPPLSSMLATLHNPETAEGLEKKYRLGYLKSLDLMVAGMLGIQVPFTQPISSSSFTKYVAGVHGNGIKVNPNTYQAFPTKPFELEGPNAIYASSVIGGNMVLTRLEELIRHELGDEKRKALKEKARLCAGNLRQIALSQGRITIEEVDSYINEIFNAEF